MPPVFDIAAMLIIATPLRHCFRRDTIELIASHYFHCHADEACRA
jgi:hypothetical protein